MKAVGVNAFDFESDFHTLREHYMKRAVAKSIEVGIYHQLRVTNSEKILIYQ